MIIGFDDNNPLSEEECYNIIRYLRTRFVRYLISIKKKTQLNARDVFQFVPMQNFNTISDIDWSSDITIIDKQLYLKYNLSKTEIAYIESMIKPLE